MRLMIRKENSSDWDFAKSVSTKAEVDLQNLLIESPSLIPVDEIREGISPLVVAVGEIGLPGSGNTDVLAVTAEGEIALIECKLAANREIKRKVIGQILEYAAFLWEMSYEDLDSRVMNKRGKSLAQLVEDAVAGEWNQHAFLEGINNSLQSGDFLLIIVVDEINPELRRIVRYINECGSADFSFHALELKQYKSEGLEILAPHLHGIAPTSKSSKSKKRKWTEQEFFDELSPNLQPDEVRIVEDIYQWGQDTADRMWFGSGSKTGSITYHYLPDGVTASVFSIFTDNHLYINYGSLNDRFEKSILEAFHKKLTSIDSFKNIPPDFKKWPSFKISEAFPTNNEVEQFKMVVEELRAVLYRED